MLNFDAINQHVLAHYPGVLHEWLPGGKVNGREYVCADLCGGSGHSFSVNIDSGVWSDFAAVGVGGGDPISLYAAIRHLKQGEAARELADRFGGGSELRTPPAVKPAAKGKGTPIIPVPADAPPPPDKYSKKNDAGIWVKMPLAARWTYRTAEGAVIGHVCRFNTADGGKEVVAQVFCSHDDGARRWRWLSFPQPRPMFGLDRLAQAPEASVILVEGEKCVEALQAALDDSGCDSYVAASWPGGGKAAGRVDWSPLAGRKVVLWPDFDAKVYKGTQTLMPAVEQPGLQAMLVIAKKIKNASAGLRILRYEPGEKPDGWDVADALAEGMALKQCMAFIRARLTAPEDLVAPEPEEVPPGEEPEVPDYEPAPAEAVDALATLAGAPFQVLGYDHGLYFYLPRGTGQVVELSAAGHIRSNLRALAPEQFWFARFGTKKNGPDWDAAANTCLRASEAVGIYDPGRIRGRGAWEDEGRSVLHLGDRLLVDGRSVPVDDISSRFIYEAGIPMEHGINAAPLSTKDANRFAALCDLPTWESGISGRLLAGWCVVAPICGALSWRPHIWCTGSAGSGKSWVMDNILRPAIGPAALCVQSNTTEAGLRQVLKYDARPVLFDEAEGEDNESRTRIQRVLELMRQASSENGAAIVKGSAGGRAQTFRIRSMFAFSSIGVGATQKADNSRLTVLSLVKDESPDRVERFEFLKKTRHEVLTPEFLAGLRARTVSLVPVIRKNAEVFARAAAARLGSQRAGDQVGALLAGAYSLYSAAEISLDEATTWVSSQDWGEAVDLDENTDEARCLAVILEAVLRVDTGKGSTELSVGEAVSGHRSVVDVGPSQADIDKALGRVGIKRDDEQFMIISNTHSGIAKILRETPWATNWSRILLRLPGATRTGPVRFAGSVGRGVSVLVPEW